MFKLIKKRKDGSIELTTLAWWLIGLLVLILAIGGIFILRQKGINLLDFISAKFRFR